MHDICHHLNRKCFMNTRKKKLLEQQKNNAQQIIFRMILKTCKLTISGTYSRVLPSGRLLLFEKDLIEFV